VLFSSLKRNYASAFDKLSTQPGDAPDCCKRLYIYYVINTVITIVWLIKFCVLLKHVDIFALKKLNILYIFFLLESISDAFL